MGLAYLINRRVLGPVGIELRRVPAPTDFEIKLLTLIRDLGVTCVLDVGAHWGEFAQRLQALGYAGRIVSFEPVPASFAELERRALGNPRWQVRREAITDTPGPIRLHITQDTSCTSTLMPRVRGREFAGLTVTSTATVPGVTLDAVWDECVQRLVRPVVLLKTDTQGFDLHVIDSVEGRPLPAVVTEASIAPLYQGAPHFCALLRSMESRGYQLAALVPLGWPADRVIELDCLFRRSSFER